MRMNRITGQVEIFVARSGASRWVGPPAAMTTRGDGFLCHPALWFVGLPPCFIWAWGLMRREFTTVILPGRRRSWLNPPDEDAVPGEARDS
jgi:hypothetical protein